ncbi:MULTISPECIES: acyltransferase family protein [Clostridium]|uniref:Acyltransferase 3 domain-containing protein n=1 Tax=Clostridium manihotivorum TaxID=2320868 RepID=A0A3R5QX82_9CLOT|nr:MULTISPECIES: acyltransferase family protein [Clostridium]QAA34770.1 hypothetical protein C1I91_25770 [Clostridium manihotivorum]
METKRVEWVDVCKGLAILAIFIGHIGPQDIITTFVFRYHVPLFFFLSGFFFSRRKVLTAKDYIIKCIKGTLVPYMFFCAINIVVEIVVNNGDVSKIPAFLTQGLFGVRDHIDFAVQLWFLTCLFSIQIIYYILNRILKKSILIVIITFTMTIMSAFFLKMPFNTTMFLNIDSAIYYTFFYCIGDLIYPKLESLSMSKTDDKTKKIIKMFGIITLIVTFYIYCKFSVLDEAIRRHSDISSIAFINTTVAQIITLFITFILIAANIIVAFSLSKSTYLADMGKNTIILCGFERVSMIIVFQVLGFMGIQLKTGQVIYKILIAVLKAAVIQKLFFKLFNNNIPWATGRSVKQLN